MRDKSLRVILAVISMYHLCLGALAFISKTLAARIASDVFNMNLVFTEQLGYIVGLLAAYAIIFGVFTALAAFDPLKYAYVIHVGILLYLLRLVHRLLYADVVRNAFGVSNLNYWLEIALLIFFGASLYLLRPRQTARQSNDQSAE